MNFILWQILFTTQNVTFFIHFRANQCYFRNFRSSPAEQRVKVNVKGEEEAEGGHNQLDGGHGGVADLQI